MYKNILKDFILSSEQSSWPIVTTHLNVPDVILSTGSKQGVQNIKTCGPHSHLEHLVSPVSAYEELNRHKGFHRLQLNCIFATLSSPDDPWSAIIEEQEHEKDGVRNYVPYRAILSICNTPLMPKCAKVRNCNNTKNPPFPGFAALAKCSCPDVKQPQQLIFSVFSLCYGPILRQNLWHDDTNTAALK